MLKLIEKLCAACGPSGAEDAVKDIIKEEISSLDEVQEDALGNLILHRPGAGESVMFVAHMDEEGFLITHIEQDGTLRFAGDFDAKQSINALVVLENGVRGILRGKGEKLTDWHIDIGAKNLEMAETMAEVGMMGSFDSAFFVQGTQIFGKALSSRISCAVLIDLAKQDSPKDRYFAFCVQENLGQRGSYVLTHQKQPDVVIAVGGAPNCKLGKGVGIKVRDKSGTSHHQVRNRLKKTAQKMGIDHQMDISETGGIAALQQSGTLAGAVGVPILHFGTPVQCADQSDIEACKKLLRTIYH